MNTITQDERRAALDQFAAGNGNGGSVQSMVPAVRQLAAPTDRVFGAQQVAVYRDEARILQKLAALGAAAGDAWFYRYPVKNRSKGTTDWIEGPSIKLANDVARIFGNCDVDTRVIDLGDTWVIYARFTDFETGYSLTRPFQQRKSQRAMNTENDRALDIAFQIGVSKAIRNVVVNALQTFADYAFEAAHNSLVDKIGKDINRWRARTVEGLGKIPVEVTRAEHVMGRAVKDWTAPDIARVIAMMKAIADGMATVEETFPPIGSSQPTTSGTADANDSGAEEEIDHEAAEAAASKAAAEQAAQRATPEDHQSAAPASQPAPATGTSQGNSPGAGTASTKQETPANEKQYVDHAKAWIASGTNADDLEKQWKAEKNIRNRANVAPETRDDLEKAMRAKAADLRKG